MEYTQDMVLDHDRASAIRKLVNITGKEAYDKYGLKRDEFVSENVVFPNGNEIEVRLVIPNGDEVYTWTEAILYNHKENYVVYGEPSDEFFGEWWVEDHEAGDNYIVNVKF